VCVEQICSRGDLTATGKSPFGCYDTKVTSYRYGASKLKAEILNGPTGRHSESGADLPPFSWDEGGGIFEGISHERLPNLYNFSFIPTQPTVLVHDLPVATQREDLVASEM
jgi:hypothetical protein